MSEWTKEQAQASAASVKKMLRSLERNGPLLVSDLAKVTGLTPAVAGQRLKRPVREGKVIIIRRWGTNGETLYALPGQPIPSQPRRLPPTADERRQSAAMDADHDQWYAALQADAVRQRAATVATMRARV